MSVGIDGNSRVTNRAAAENSSVRGGFFLSTQIPAIPISYCRCRAGNCVGGRHGAKLISLDELQLIDRFAYGLRGYSSPSADGYYSTERSCLSEGNSANSYTGN